MELFIAFVYLFFSLSSTVHAQAGCVTCLLGLPLNIATTICPTTTTSTSTVVSTATVISTKVSTKVSTKISTKVSTIISTKLHTVVGTNPAKTITKTVTATKTKTSDVVPSCAARSAQLYLASPTPGCATSFSNLKRTEIVPGQCVNVADIGGKAFTPKGYFSLNSNDNLPGEKCFVNVFTVANCKGGAQTSYGSGVAGSDRSLSIKCQLFKTNNNKAVVSFKYTCGCGNTSSTKLLFGRESEMSVDQSLGAVRDEIAA